MGTSDWHRVRKLFNAALERPADVREEFVHAQAKDDAELASQVLAMLRSDADSAVLQTSGGVQQLEQVRHQEVVRTLVAALGDRYELHGTIGEGGMAIVFRATDLKHGRDVAIKVLKADLAAAIGGDRFLAEIRTTATLQHPHIVPLHDSGEANGVLYYVMPFIEGETLGDRLDREGRLPIDDAVRIATGIADALDFAHRKGIVHRDVKPGNVLIQGGVPMVADFGIAVVSGADRHTRFTEAGSAIGSPRYMSPEQIEGAADIDAKTDIYSLACVLYEMLSGESPFSAKSPAALAAQHLTSEPAPLRQRRREVPDWLERLVSSGLEKKRTRRLASAQEFGERLRTGTAPRSKIWEKPLRLAAAAAVVVAAYVGTTQLSRDAPLAGGTLEHSQVTFNGRVTDGSISPDGGFLAYVEQDESTRRVLLQDRNGGQAIVVDSAADALCCVIWSPDGRLISYQRGPRGIGGRVISSRLGGDSYQVEADAVARWSPDGRFLLSWSPPEPFLVITDVGTRQIVDTVPLPTDLAFVQGADWAPDGDAVVVAVQYDELDTEVRVLDLDGELLAEVVPRSRRYLFAPSWDGESESIYFASYTQVFRIPVDRRGRPTGPEVRILTDAKAIDGAGISTHRLSLSTSGNGLAYVRDRGRSVLWRFEPSAGGAIEVPWLASRFTTGSAFEERSALAPDGRRVAFQRLGDVHLTGIDDLEPSQRLTFGGVATRGPLWSPDGQRLAFVARDSVARSVHIIDVRERGSTIVETSSTHEVAWLDDSRLLYTSGDQRSVRVLDLEEGTDSEVMSEDEGVWWYSPRVSPDGQLVAFSLAGRFSGAGLVNVESGQMGPLAYDVHPLGWSEDGLWVYGIQSASRTVPGREIYRTRVTDLHRELIGVLPAAQPIVAGTSSISPDGRVIVGPVAVPSTDLWLLEGLTSGR